MTMADSPSSGLVVVPLATMLKVADYLADRPYREVAPLAAQLAELTTLEEHLAAQPEET